MMMRQVKRFTDRVLRENTPSNAVKRLVWFPKLPPCPSRRWVPMRLFYSLIF